MRKRWSAHPRGAGRPARPHQPRHPPGPGMRRRWTGMHTPSLPLSLSPPPAPSLPHPRRNGLLSPFRGHTHFQNPASTNLNPAPFWLLGPTGWPLAGRPVWTEGRRAKGKSPAGPSPLSLVEH
ncbi:hypothetical protein HJG60_009276 [Phyllostomus discolor]|uniref:Uncharacterized protein n=1 Tax=Phyllostomus discolor TaxID=89673 RepID=A0A833YFX7_9CHIR|nr:hypothetical protein HJG60_009276 [Phyllostomus discolor]